jgi:penicillin-insensitive murein endopeptidase
MSIGRPSAGRLLNGVHMPEGPAWRLVDPPHTWGTQETVDALKTAINAVFDRFPDTPPLPIGHISAEHGGHLRPHISHQSGRDVDLGYYYREDDSWYRRAHAGNLDLERTWSLVRAFVTQTDVEMILIDRSIQRLLRDHAEKIGEPKAWLDDLFAGKGPRGPLIRHARGHSTHLHVRFFSPTAQETARRCIPALVEEGVIEAPPHFVYHRVRKGETLGKLAKRYGTTVRAIMRANGLRRTLIQARKTYRIPRPGLPPGLKEPVRIPGRRLPGG